MHPVMIEIEEDPGPLCDFLAPLFAFPLDRMRCLRIIEHPIVAALKVS